MKLRNEVEAAFYVGNVVLRLRVVNKTRVLGLFEVLGHFQLHVLTVPNPIVFNPCSNLLKSAAGSQSAHDLI